MSENTHPEYISSDIFIATPTHICKRYCARQFREAIVRHGIKLGCGQMMACNSACSAFGYYRCDLADEQQVNYHDMELSNDFFNYPDSIHRRIVVTMNYLRNHFLSGKWKVFLSLEADVILAADTIKNILARMNAGAKILHTNCYTGFNLAQEYSFTERITMGCTAVVREVMEQIVFRYDPVILKAHHDAIFARDCIEAGIPMNYDPFIVLEHAHDGRGQRGWQQLPQLELASKG